MKVFIVVAVIIVTICLACLMKAKAEGDRIYDELAYKHFSSKEERKANRPKGMGRCMKRICRLWRKKKMNNKLEVIGIDHGWSMMKQSLRYLSQVLRA